MRVGQPPMRPDRWKNDVRDQPVLVNLWATCLGIGRSALTPARELFSRPKGEPDHGR